ncbi:MAG: hypothetical protein NT144_07890 [Bacteroidia bacterium]|nr:hypothetical protein [Bacteroidia bacterium]
MKKLAFILILTLPLFAGKAAAQCSVSWVITSGAVSQTVCVTNDITDIKYDAGAKVDSYNSGSSTLPAGLNASWDGDLKQLTISGTPTASGTYTVYFDCSSPTATCSASGTITVTPASFGGSISGSATVCTGTNSTTLTLSGNTGDVTEWQFSTNSWSTHTVISNTTLAETANNLTATTEYRAVVKNGVCAATNSDLGTVTVVADPTLSAPTALTTLCQGGSTTISTSVTAGGTPGYNYQWEYSADGLAPWASVVNLTPAGISYSGGTSSSLTVTGNGSELIESKYYHCVLGSTTPTVGCDQISAVAEIQAVAPVAPTISSQPATPTTLCVGGTVNLSVTASGSTGSYTYQWYSNNSASTVGATNLGGGAQTSGYTPPTGTAETKYYYCVIGGTGGACGTVTSDFAKVIVVADPTLSAPTAETILCKGGNTTVSTSVTAGGTPGYNYQWEYSADGSTLWASVVDLTPAGITYTNGTTESLTVTGNGSEPTGDKFYRCVLSSTTASVGCDQISATAKITTVADPTLSAPTAETILCKGGNTTVSTSVTVGGTPGYTYQWEYSADGSTLWASVVDLTPAGITYTNGTPESLTVTGNGTEASSDKYYRCVLTSTTPSVGCDQTSATAKITTVDDPNVTIQPNNPAAICAGGTTSNITITAAGGTPALTYKWKLYNAGSWGDVVNGTPSGSVYSGASQAAAVCSELAATINLTGLLSGSISTVNYTINGFAQDPVFNVVATGTSASFFSRVLTASDNGKTLSITGITTTSATPNCSKTFSQNLTLIVNTATIPTITGNAAPCIGSAGNVYTTESAGMSAFSWTISGGGTITETI